MRIEIGAIIADPRTFTDLDISFRPSDINISSDDCEIVGDITFKGTAAYADKGLVILTGRFKLGTIQLCARCSRSFELKMEIPVQLRFMPSSQLKDGSEEYGSEEIYTYEGKYIVPDTAFRDTILLGIPDKVLCDDNCKGLCGKCGKDLNLGECDCTKNPGKDSPFSALKDLLK